MTNAECLLFTAAIFLLTFYLLKKKSISVIWPMAAIIIFLLTGTIGEISTRITNEIIVYNTPGFSTIGIRTGKILNLYSDTIFARAEVKRHCSTLGLKINLNRIINGDNCIKAGKTKILITGSISQEILDSFSPDFVILTGSKPEMECDWNPGLQSEVTIIAADGSPHFRKAFRKQSQMPFKVHLVRKSGAFIRRI
jgi:hypothetical protein